MFKKVLIANRGEIALRVVRACRALGIRTVAIHSTVDLNSLHVTLADEAVCVGGAEASSSYLNVPQIVAAAEITGADAVHPGYGFLSENADFAEICAQCGLTFIGPTPEAMRAWGDKVSARTNAVDYGLPLLPGTSVLRDVAHAKQEAAKIGFPVILKASGGGGGRGMRIVRSEEELPAAFESASVEAEKGFNNPDVYLERFIERPRHIEFQVLADQHGNAWTLGERECSLQRRHQKVIEEAPSPSLTDEQRREMDVRIRKAVLATGYHTVGTLEFLMDEDGSLYFMEMNTRIQVEHPVTEQVTGVDLVVQQIRAAAGEKIFLPAHHPWPTTGHSIECRINAEDARSFAPWPGLITRYVAPGGLGIRVDAAVYSGWRVPSVYDSLIAKLIATGKDREDALTKMRIALDEFIVEGIRTNIPLHAALVRHEPVVEGKMSTRTIEELVAMGF